MRTVNPARHAARRAHILQAAAGVFAEFGFERATTAAVCRAAGIGSGTLFHYFPDKRAIFHALFADDLEATRARVEQLDESDPLSALITLVDHRIAHAGDPLVPGLIVAAIQHASVDEDFAALIGDDEALLGSVVARLLSAAQAASQIDATLDVDTTARWVCGLIDALYFQAGNQGFHAETDSATLHMILRRYLGVADR